VPRDEGFPWPHEEGSRSIVDAEAFATKAPLGGEGGGGEGRGRRGGDGDGDGGGGGVVFLLKLKKLSFLFQAMS